MGKFNKTGKREMPALNTSSLPDLIFTLLFFFMIVTTMREVTLKVQFTLPQGTELEKLEKKSLVTFIYVGEPLRNIVRKWVLKAVFSSTTAMLKWAKYRTSSSRNVLV